MMSEADFLRLDALTARYRSGQADPVDVVGRALNAAEASLTGAGAASTNAFITVMRQSAEAAAVDSRARYQSGAPLSALDGVPVAVKDFYDTAGVRTTAGSRHLAERVPETDAVLVHRLKNAGAIIIGKTNMDAFGQATSGLASDFGPVRNPRFPNYVPGGSSSGSAAAIALGLVALTIDTDAAGSARLPAACCGHVGFKPSFGRMSGVGILPDQPADETILTFAHGGLQARSVAVIAAAFPLLADGPTAPSPARVRFRRLANVVTPTSWAAATDNVLKAAADLGKVLAPIDLPVELARFDMSEVETHRANAARLFFAEQDVLILPTLAHAAPLISPTRAGEDIGVSPANVFFANYFGFPALTLPVGVDQAGGPISIQLASPPNTDEALLAIGSQLEAILAGQA